MALGKRPSPLSGNKDQPSHQQQDQPRAEETRWPKHEGNRVPLDREKEVSEPPQRMDADTLSTSSERHSKRGAMEHRQRMKWATSSVWLSGILSGRSYAPQPNGVDEAVLSESAKEELLKERTYTIPRGYKYYKDNLPPVLNPVPENGFRTALVMHIVFFGIAFVFTLAAACPIPWFRGRDIDVRGVNYHGRQFTLWKATGGNYPVMLVRDMKNCPLEKQFYQSIAACIIVGCVLSLVSLLIAAARLFGRSSYGWILLFSFLAFAWTLCGNAMSISMYYLSRCDAPRFSDSSRLDAGFALSLLAWVLQLGGFLAVTLVTKVNIGPVLKELRVMDTYYMALLCVSLLFLCVANATTVWKRRFNTPEVDVVRVTYWHTELLMPNGTNLYYGRHHYRCDAFNSRMKASISFLILSSITLFLAIVLAIPAFISRGYRIASLVFSIVTLVFLVVSWVIAVVVRYGNSCMGAVDGTKYKDYPGVPSGILNGLTSFPGYGVQEGLILSIVAWVTVLGATVLNFSVPWPTKT
ncbi:hypothetical protein LSCM1_03133 [Leishmania martiniquensis]|uniref:Amastin surface glycofamily protein n=1 Tax=Leishmania martiniquensis TaxID=1580590 RepID=A0A836KQD9_9TRYP|nr:hypothetical protein LSCM1_03133 [Leishmania martiniquensis]